MKIEPKNYFLGGKALRNHNHDQDDIDEMRAEEQAQQAEAQITMFELLRSRYFLA